MYGSMNMGMLAKVDGMASIDFRPEEKLFLNVRLSASKESRNGV